MKELLEYTFDIPFLQERGEDGYPWIRIAPAGEKDQLFSIQIINRFVRLFIDFIPQTFSANLIESMGRADDSKKLEFCRAAQLMLEKGAQISMSINGIDVSPVDTAQWPQESWQKLGFHAVVVLRDDIAGNPQRVEETIKEWGGLVMGGFLSLVRIDQCEMPNATVSEAYSPQTEGDKISVIVNRYERSAMNRFLCLAKHGCVCSICGFDFEKEYGAIGRGYIHVHHVTPVSMLGPGYHIDPERDLIPVCPNCHAMLHRKSPPFLPSEIAAARAIKD